MYEKELQAGKESWAVVGPAGVHVLATLIVRTSKYLYISW